MVLSLPKHLKWTRLGIGQVLIGLTFISLYFSPALSNLFEFIAVILVASSNALRGRVRDFILSPLAKWYGLFLLVLILGAVNGILRGNSDLSEMWGWRKVLLLPLGAALFMGEEVAKRRLAIGFVVVSVVFALWSNINFLIGLNPVVAKNYAVQGMFFTAAVLPCIQCFLSSNSLKVRTILFFAIGLLTIPVFFYTSGRSGCLAWIIGVTAAVFLARIQWTSMKLVPGVFAIGVGISLLLLSDNATQSISSGIDEMKNSSVQIEQTRMGDRVIMWEKTLQMAPKYVFLGAGLAGFSRAFDDNWKLNDGIEWRGLSDPHNQYLKIMIELGLPGLVVFLLFLSKIISSALVLGRSQRIGLGVLFAWCATSFFSAHFTTFHEGHFIWLFVGIFLSGGKPHRLAR